MKKEQDKTPLIVYISKTTLKIELTIGGKIM